MDEERIIAVTRRWVNSVVVGLNLCPFAKKELVQDRIRFVVSDAGDALQLLFSIADELERLEKDDAIETTLLIHPNTLQDFFRYNQFLDAADRLLVEMELDGVYQIASFHPDYQFHNANPDDVENYTNRSPYPMLHLLREDSLSRAIESYPDIEIIPEENILKMNELGLEKMKELLKACLQERGE